MTSTMSAAEFMAAAPRLLNANTAWGSRYAAELRRIVIEHARHAPRSLQVHLGPSELGYACDRQVVGKMAGVPATNHVVDPWPSIVGTAIHAWLAEAFTAVNQRHGVRFVAEHRVTPHPDHPGTADLYDAAEQAVVDHKCLAESSMAKIRKQPPQHYVIQLLLYGRGYRLLGLPVRRVVLAAWPRTGSSVDGLYVWDHLITADDDALIESVFRRTAVRARIADHVRAGRLPLHLVPASPDPEVCYFCLAGETEVVTRKGIRPVRELTGAPHELLVPYPARPNVAAPAAAAPHGKFQRVTVRSFGEQRLYAVNLRRYRAIKTIFATAEHRWILTDGTVVPTIKLRPATTLASVRAKSPQGTAALISVAAAQGFTYGDGTRGQGQRPATLAIYGRSTADEHMLPYFGPVKTKRYNTQTGDTVTHIYGLPRFWKDLPPLEESRSFLLSWLAGYFAADGSVSKAGQATIYSANRSALSFVRDIAAVCGVGYGMIRSHERLGTKTEPTPIYALDLTTRDLPQWFWLLPHQADAATTRTKKAPRTTYWSVISVEETDRIEEVFCATVPGVEAFGLADSLTTGNCPFYRPQSAHDNGPGCPGGAAQRRED
jgi:hypothetical protein